MTNGSLKVQNVRRLSPHVSAKRVEPPPVAAATYGVPRDNAFPSLPNRNRRRGQSAIRLRGMSRRSNLLLGRRRRRRRRNLRRTLWSRRRRRLHIHQFDFKDQRRVRTNIGAHRTLAIGKIRWNEQLIFCSLLHQLKRLSPSFDHAINRKGRRLAALI